MPFIAVGAALLIVSAILLRKAMQNQNKELIIGLNALIIAAVVLILFFGVFYNFVIP